MGEKFKAMGQYNDWIGESAADFYLGGNSFLSENFKTPVEYFPIGISFYFGDKQFSHVSIIGC